MPDDKKDNNNEEAELNPRWTCYIAIIILSLINFLNIAEVESLHHFTGSLVFGPVTFAIAIIIFILDRFQLWRDKFDFMNILDGKLEGGTLVVFVLWWASGTGYMTNVDGVAYRALNIYFSCWGNLFICIYTLNEWSAAKEILTIEEITHISPTLKGWWVFLFASIVECASAAAAWAPLQRKLPNEAAFAVAVGAATTFFSAIFVLAHYKFLTCCKIAHGGTMELIVSFAMNIYMIAALIVLTKDGGVAATITGDCDKNIPGTNIYLSLWVCTAASFYVTTRWKESKTLQFARAAEQNGAEERKKQNQTSAAASPDMDDDDDDDDDAI